VRLYLGVVVGGAVGRVIGVGVVGVFSLLLMLVCCCCCCCWW